MMHDYSMDSFNSRITEEERLLSTVAILRYDIRKDRRAHFSNLYQTYQDQMYRCNSLGLEVNKQNYMDIEDYYKSMFVQSIPQASPTI